MRERKLDKHNERNAEFAKRTDDLYEKIRTQVIDKVTVRRTRNNIKNVPAYKKDLDDQHIVFPDILPGIISGFFMAFTMSLDDFVISYFTSNTDQNLAMVVYSAARRGVEPTMYALSTLMFVAVVTLLLFINLKSIREEREADIQNKKLRAKNR